MERLTKTELRALLECIKECYPICDLESFAQRVVSRLSKIVPAEIISHNGSSPGESGLRIWPIHNGDTLSKNEIFERRASAHPVITHRGKTRDTAHGQFHRLESENNPNLGGKWRIAQRLVNQAAVNCKSKNLAIHEKLLFKLLSPHLNQAYHNAQTFTHMQHKLSLIDQALYRLDIGLIFLTPDGKIRLATTWAMQRLTRYLGLQSLRNNRLPEPLWRWVKQQEIPPRGKDDVLLRRSPFMLEHQGKRLVIRLVSDLDQRLLILEEHPTPVQLQSLVPFGVSPREAQVLDWVAQGKTNKEIGVILELSPRTVQKHLEHIYRKIYVESRTAAAAKAYEIASLASRQTGMFFLVVSSLLIT
jgi:DNA-binding CsgD family transcriptional regulator